MTTRTEERKAAGTVRLHRVLKAPAERIVATDVFNDPGMPGEACYLGWQESLEQLAALVEPEIPD